MGKMVTVSPGAILAESQRRFSFTITPITLLSYAYNVCSLSVAMNSRRVDFSSMVYLMGLGYIDSLSEWFSLYFF